VGWAGKPPSDAAEEIKMSDDHEDKVLKAVKTQTTVFMVMAIAVIASALKYLFV